MSLRDLVDRRAEIEVAGGGSFQVRGLSLEDIVLLLDNHKDALIHVFGSDNGANFEELISKFPEFIAAAISYAADEPDMAGKVTKLPIGVQLKAMEEVWELSSLDVESVGKLANGILQGLVRLNRQELKTAGEHLKTGLRPLQEQQSSSSPMDTDTETLSSIPSGG